LRHASNWLEPRVQTRAASNSSICRNFTGFIPTIGLSGFSAIVACFDSEKAEGALLDVVGFQNNRFLFASAPTKRAIEQTRNKTKTDAWRCFIAFLNVKDEPRVCSARAVRQHAT
jgi:hypothetical protein